MECRTAQFAVAVLIACLWVDRAICCAQGQPAHDGLDLSVPGRAPTNGQPGWSQTAPAPHSPGLLEAGTPGAALAYPLEDLGEFPAPVGRPGVPHRRWLGLPYSDPDAPGRHLAWGEPLVGTSWLNRPLHLGWLAGTLIGDDLVDKVTGQEADVLGGYRIGWDVDHYWGLEYRLAFARPDLQDDAAASNPRIARHWYSDFHLVHYPWGDSRWRPFLSVGLGWASFAFTDARQTAYDETLLHVPVGTGLKYYVGKWMSLRLDVTDNVALAGSGLDTMHNLSVSFGVDGHFGPGTHRKYGY